MAQPIRSYTPQRDPRDEVRSKVEDAPIQHAAALLSAYELLQIAEDRGILDALRGAMGAGDALVNKATEFAGSPEGIRSMRNFLALSRMFGNLDPARVDAVAEAIAEHQCRRPVEDCEPPSLWETLRRLTGPNSRRSLATLAAVADAFGRDPGAESTAMPSPASRRPPAAMAAVLPFVGLGLVAAVSYWIGRRS